MVLSDSIGDLFMILWSKCVLGRSHVFYSAVFHFNSFLHRMSGIDFLVLSPSVKGQHDQIS